MHQLSERNRMTARRQPALVVIVGPIASGKSTLAAEVGQRLRGRGESVAVVGLDTVAEMALPTLDWAWAHRVHGQLVGAWLATGVQRVVAEGPSTPAELAQLMDGVPSDVAVLTAVLVTPYAVALERAARDPGRGVSKDAAFLRTDHDTFEAGHDDLIYDLALDGAGETSATLADRVVQALDGWGRPGRRVRRLPAEPDHSPGCL